MKALKIALMGAIMVLSVPAHAQFANANATASNQATASATEGYSRFSIEYVNRTINPDYDGVDSYSTNGFGLTWLKGISISQKLPLFIEVGVGFDYGRWSDSYEDYYEEIEQSLNTLAFNVPVNLAYKFNVSDGVAITPYVGVNFRLNALAKVTEKWEDEYDEGSDDWSLFDKDETSKDGQWKRFQAGWHIGAGVSFKKLYLGLNYGTDFNAICKKTNTSTLMISLGINL